MQKLKIYMSYDGTRYHGFQRQKNHRFTIQEEVEKQLSRLSSERVSILSSGRTDAGVHARVQMVHANVPDAIVDRLREDRFQLALNSLLPHDIRILKVERTDPEFHAIAHAKRKMYVYFIDPNPVQMPWLRHYTWNLRLPLDWAAIQKATLPLLGHHDFQGFCGANSSAKTTDRTVFEARWEQTSWGHGGKLWAFRIVGNGFLKQMVRNIVGTLVQVGMNKASPEIVTEVLASKSRQKAGPTAPARGLWLWDILY